MNSSTITVVKIMAIMYLMFEKGQLENAANHHPMRHASVLYGVHIARFLLALTEAQPFIAEVTWLP